MNIHTEIKNFVQEFLTDRHLYFESVENYPGMRSIVPQIGDYKIRQDILGNIEKAYTFAFVGVENFDYGTSNKNENNMKLFDDFSEWIALQERNKNYPNFGIGYSNFKWEVLNNMANISFYDESSRTTKYMLSCRLYYTERS